MHANRKGTSLSLPLSRVRFLALSVHFDAARLAPRRWLAAIWWRILGKRLRARARLAPLLAASPRAYRWWLTGESERSATFKDDASTSVRIVAFVEAGKGQQESIASLSNQKITVLSIGGSEEDSNDFAGFEGMFRSDEVVWVLVLKAGDRLAPDAASIYRTAVVEQAGSPDSSYLIYADDDVLDRCGQRSKPHFKPDWNAELFQYFDYLTNSCIVRMRFDEVLQLIRIGKKKAFGPSFEIDLSSLVPGGIKELKPFHLPFILHHRVKRLEPQMPPKIRFNEGPCSRISLGAASFPLVTVVVPTRNRADLLRNCINGLSRTEYPAIEILVVDNGSDEPETLDYLANLDQARYRVIRDPGAFNFSRINNRAVREARGEMLCLLNNDIEVLDQNWLALMVKQALRPEVGAVGAQLLYPDGRIQHAGVVLGICGGAAHAHRLLRPDQEGYFRRHVLPQFVSAVTAACLVVRRKSYEAVGGLDEENFPVAFNDVDLCMRLNANGWQSLYEPRARMVHHESVSRGFDRDPVGAARFAREFAALDRTWGTHCMVDPFHHVSLSPFSEQYVIGL